MCKTHSNAEAAVDVVYSLKNCLCSREGAKQGALNMWAILITCQRSKKLSYLCTALPLTSILEAEKLSEYMASAKGGKLHGSSPQGPSFSDGYMQKLENHCVNWSKHGRPRDAAQVCAEPRSSASGWARQIGESRTSPSPTESTFSPAQLLRTIVFDW